MMAGKPQIIGGVAGTQVSCVFCIYMCVYGGLIEVGVRDVYIYVYIYIYECGNYIVHYLSGIKR